MKATIEVKEVEGSKEEYPVIKKSLSDDCIVRFTSPCNGIVIAGSPEPFGRELDDWNESNFEVFTGEVILKNI